MKSNSLKRRENVMAGRDPNHGIGEGLRSSPCSRFDAVYLVPEGWCVLSSWIETPTGERYRHHCAEGLSEDHAKHLASQLSGENEKAMAAPSKESQQQQAPSALAISGLLACHDCGWRGNPEDTTWTDIERNETDGESPEDQRSCPECLSINLSDQAG